MEVDTLQIAYNNHLENKITLQRSSQIKIITDGITTKENNLRFYIILQRQSNIF